MSLFDTEAYTCLSVQEVYELSFKVLTAAGLAEDQATSVAKVITAGERDECRSHGLYRLPGCVQTIQSGKLNKDAKPDIKDVTPALLKADAKFGYSVLAFDQAVDALAAKAKQNGIAALAINNCFHFSALWPEIEALTQRGVAALAMTPSHAWVAPAGGKRGLLGTNPMAFGWPRPGPNPYVFDFATSAIARGDLALHDIAGKPIPEGWGVDKDGNPTTVAREALDGAMLTFGGHKGSALSTMIELMAGPLIGDLTSLQSMAFDDNQKLAPMHGELVLAFDPGLLGGGDLETQSARAEQLFAAFADQGARLPSQRRFEARQRSLADGVRVPQSLYDRITALDL
ncbi:Ldh family oxidoreductase [Brevundimonas sp.]|uniref:Ldh family oxidoreductase n=1 Tax=Brevundimonas sp. TaxID=1871086 RepID=UPI0028974BEF|nr:Ldh family oxidoreductase [Brevundimonas sp.]